MAMDETRNNENSRPQLAKHATFIPGLDHLVEGGLPEGRATLLSGTAGSGKTVLAAQFLADGVMKAGEGGVFVTFEETPADIRNNMASFGWDIARWEAENKWAFVDASVIVDHEYLESGPYDFGALMVRIELAIKKVKGRRVVLDSLGAVFSQYQDAAIVRLEMFRLASALKRLRVTTLITAERVAEYGHIARFGVEEFVADNVIILRNVLEDEKRRRTIEILKLRGAAHKKGEYPFVVIPNEGVEIIPLSAVELKQKSSSVRVTSGNSDLDDMCGGGFFRDSIVLVSGATGTGKTLLTAEFIRGGYDRGERNLLFAFEESREQLFRNASGWGIDFEKMEAEGRLFVYCAYPETAGLEDHLIQMKKRIEAYKPHRIAVDSLSALERVSTPKGFREFVIGITSFVKHQELTGLFTSTTPTLMGGTSTTEHHISTITDTIILLRYVELFGEMRRGLTVLKMRGSKHDKIIREFTIDDKGMHIGQPFRNVSGIISGHIIHLAESELERMSGLFED